MPAGQTGSQIARRAQVTLASLAGALALWIVLRGNDSETLWRVASRARPLWIIAAIASVAFTVVASVARWRVLLQKLDERRTWRHLVHALLVGQTLNILLPVRLGEVTRSYIVSRTEAIPVARVLTTIAVEKIADILIVGATTAWLLAFVALPDWVQVPARAVIITGAIAAFAAALLSLRADALAHLSRLVARVVPARWRPRVERQFLAASEGLSGVRTRKGHLLLWTLSVAVLLLAASTNYLLFLAFDLPLPATAAVFLLVALQLGNAIVSVPGNLGVFHYVTLLVLSSYGVDRNTAVAYAMTLYVVALGPKILLGAGFLMFADTRLDLRAIAGRA